jgi:phage/plasmid-associated DNA primase
VSRTTRPSCARSTRKYRSRNLIQIDYVAGASCVHFKTDLLEPVLSAEDIELLQRYCGLILIGGNRAQKILMMIGEGGTGKGTITRLIALVIGRSNVVQLRVDQLTGRFETARVVGKLLLNVVEATANYLNREGAEVIKALVGHDPMEAGKKYCQDPISFDGTFPVHRHFKRGPEHPAGGR